MSVSKLATERALVPQQLNMSSNSPRIHRNVAARLYILILARNDLIKFRISG